MPTSLTRLAAHLAAVWGRDGNLPMTLLDILGAPGSRPRTFVEVRAAAGTSAIATAAALLLLEREELVGGGVEDGVRRYALTPGARRVLGILRRGAAA